MSSKEKLKNTQNVAWEKAQQHAEAQKAVERFLAAGGKITKCASSEVARENHYTYNRFGTVRAKIEISDDTIREIRNTPITKLAEKAKELNLTKKACDDIRSKKIFSNVPDISPAEEK